MFCDILYAMGNAGHSQEPKQAFISLIPLLAMFLIFYVLLIRPQQKRAKKHKEFLDNLKKGDMVVTAGGLHGKVVGITDTIVTLEIGEKVRVKVSKDSIAGPSRIKG